MLAALAFGLLTAALLVAYLRDNERRQSARDAASVSVVVAKKEIPLGSNISMSMLEERLVPPEAAVAAAFTESGKVAGLRARYPIPAGAQIVPGMVVQGGSADALSYVVPPGKRAVAVAASEVIGGGGHIRPGDFVDVLVTIEVWKLVGGQPPSGSDRPKGVWTVLQNVEVLAVADDAEKIGATGPGDRSDEDKDKKIRSVVLGVDPNQAQTLFLAESEGKIRLSLRPFGDREETPLAPVLEPFVLPGSAATPRATPTATPAR
jgi:pilus assembly protein CpaB